MSGEAERVTVSTYVPEPQRDEWAAHARELGMSQSEFIRTMVQAGRRGFAFDGPSIVDDEPGSSRSTPWGDGLKTTVLEVLRSKGPLAWDELIDAVVGDLESEIERTLLGLQDEDRVQHRPREGTYAAVGDADGD